MIHIKNNLKKKRCSYWLYECALSWNTPPAPGLLFLSFPKGTPLPCLMPDCFLWLPQASQDQPLSLPEPYLWFYCLLAFLYTQPFFKV